MKFSLKEKEDIKLMNDFKIKIMIKLKKKKKWFYIKKSTTHKLSRKNIEVADPYRFIAIRGTFDLLDNVKDNIVKIIPQLILPLKTALNTRDVDIIAVTLKVIQKLVKSSDLAGEALVQL